ncbi:hypothetical protein HBH53_259110 [Parastagonospora nodorum]|nr:hypothetical protein HBH53_259110 [Parastagonospora nodorum]
MAFTATLTNVDLLRSIERIQGIKLEDGSSYTVVDNLEGVNLLRQGTVSILQFYVLPKDYTYLVDIHQLQHAAFSTTGKHSGKSLKAILEAEDIPKVFFDVRNDSDALYHHFQISLSGVHGIQLMELATRRSNRSCVECGEGGRKEIICTGKRMCNSYRISGLTTKKWLKAYRARGPDSVYRGHCNHYDDLVNEHRLALEHTLAQALTRTNAASRAIAPTPAPDPGQALMPLATPSHRNEANLVDWIHMLATATRMAVGHLPRRLQAVDQRQQSDQQAVLVRRHERLGRRMELRARDDRYLQYGTPRSRASRLLGPRFRSPSRTREQRRRSPSVRRDRPPSSSGHRNRAPPSSQSRSGVSAPSLIVLNSDVGRLGRLLDRSANG